jgi:hypothetical protein
MLEYFGHNKHPLPPVIESGRIGALRRITNERLVKSPIKAEELGLPPLPTMVQVNIARQERNRKNLLMLIESGVDDARELCRLAKCSPSTVWNHLHPLEKEGVVIVDRQLKPWIIRMSQKEKP